MNDFNVIKEFKQLYDEGIITQEEFENKKREVLGMRSKEEELRIAEENRIREEEYQKTIEREKLIEAEHQRKLEEAQIAEREHQRKVEEARLAEQERIRKLEEEKRKKKEDKKAANKGKNKLIIVAIVAIVIIVGVFVVLSGNDNGNYDDYTDYNSTYEWPSSGLATSIPEPTIKTGHIQNHYDIMMDFYLYKATLDDFETYVSECKEVGFTIVEKETGTDYSAYNEDKTRYVDIEYYEDSNKMYVVVRAPEEWSEINWPKSDIAELIPQPDSLIGKVNTDSAETLDVDISNVSLKAFNEYINKCIEVGFDVDYNRYEKSFNASDKNGYYLSIDLETFDVMNIRLTYEE